MTKSHWRERCSTKLTILGEDTPVFDSVTHLYDTSGENVKTEGGEQFRQHLFGFHRYLTPEDDRILGAEEFLRE
jgi:hypothetical protein